MNAFISMSIPGTVPSWGIGRPKKNSTTNTTIGVLLLIAGGLTGGLYQLMGADIVWVLGASSLLASALSLRLKPVSG